MHDVRWRQRSERWKMRRKQSRRLRRTSKLCGESQKNAKLRKRLWHTHSHKERAALGKLLDADGVTMTLAKRHPIKVRGTRRAILSLLGARKQPA